MSAVAEQAERGAVTAAPARIESKHVTVIAPWRQSILARLGEVWTFRALFPYLAKELIMRRYRRTYLSWIWIPLRPGLQILSGGLVFGGFLQVSSGDRPYLIYVSLSTAAWVLFERALHWGTRGVRGAGSFSGGSFFPRIMVVVASSGPAIMDFLINQALFMIALIYFSIARQTNYLAPPQQWAVGAIGLLLLLLFGLSVGLITGPLTALTKEIRYVTSYLVQFLLFMTPVYYPISELPDRYRTLLELNPLTAPMEMVQFGFVGSAPPSPLAMTSCLVGIFVFCGGGLWFFNRFERTFVARL
ncbi:MAG TPA: ABC transporter permease [Gaiellaceae bacterium]|jgi:lipopolysaccharide transport system permease protein